MQLNFVKIKPVYMLFHIAFVALYIMSIGLFEFFLYRQVSINADPSITGCNKVQEAALVEIKREREKVYFSDPIQLLLNLFVLLLICKFAREAADQYKRVRHPNYDNQKV